MRTPRSDGIDRRPSMAIRLVGTIGWLGLLAGSAIAQASQPASIRGSVVEVTTNTPIANAELSLVNVLDGASTIITTGRTGEFLFSGLEPGRYLLRPQGDRYVDITEEFPPRPRQSIEIESGQDRTDVTLRLGVAGVIVGTVQDVERQAVANAPVSAYRYVYDDLDYRWTWTPVEHATTGDGGEFRFGGLHPGRYVVRVTPPSNVELDDSLARLPESDTFEALPVDLRRPVTTAEIPQRQRPDGHLPIYYPNTSDLRQAARIDIDYGRESQIQIFMPLEPAFSIRGEFIDPTSLGRRPTGFSLSSREIEIRYRGDVADDGTFEFSNLSPGTYEIRGTLSTNEPARYVGAPRDGLPPLPVPVFPRFDPNRLVARVEVTVTNEDVEDIVIVPEVFTVSGTVEAGDGRALPEGLFVAIRGHNDMPNPAQPRDEDGAFTITHVSEGEYRLVVTGLSGGMPAGLPAGWYVESARMGGVDALAPTFRIDRVWVQQPLEITLRRASGRLSVTVEDAGRPEEGVFVAVVPDVRRRHRQDLYRTGWTDERGVLTLDAIAPGEYRVFAWDRIAPNAWLDPEYIAGIAGQGQIVHIGDNGRENVDVRVIR